MRFYNVKAAMAWHLLDAAEALSRAAHKLCSEVPDVDDLKAEAFELGRRVSMPRSRHSRSVEADS